MSYLVVENDIKTLLTLLPYYTYCGLDIETYGTDFRFSTKAGLDPRYSNIRYIQLYPFGKKVDITDHNLVFIFDLARCDEDTLIQLKGLLFNEAFNHSITWVGHNLKFDLVHLSYHQFDISTSRFLDTMILHKLLTAGLPEFNQASLKECLSHYCQIIVDKHWQTVDWSPEMDAFAAATNNRSKQLYYLINDVVLLEPLLTTLLQRLQESPNAVDLEEALTLEMLCLPAVVELELSGLKINLQLLEEKIDFYRKEIQKTEQQLYRYFDLSTIYLDKRLHSQRPEVNRFQVVHPNINSPQTFLRILHRLGVVDPKTGELLTSTSKNVIDLIDISGYPAETQEFISLYRYYRKITKILNTYLLPLKYNLNQASQRIYANFNQLGADTGRFTSTNPNLQNLPREKEIRELFIADKDNALIIADYSQIEVRILAELCGEPALQQVYQQHQDIYKVTASKVFNVPYDEVIKEQRQKAKTIVLGFQYGMGAQKFQDYHNAAHPSNPINLEEAQHFRRAFFQAFPKLNQWHMRIRDEVDIAAQHEMTIVKRTLYGRVRYFQCSADKFPVNAVINSPVQGTSADLTKVALALIYAKKQLFCPDAKIVNTVHDEILVESPKPYAETMQSLVEHAMVFSGYKLKQVPVVVESAVATNWSEKA